MTAETVVVAIGQWRLSALLLTGAKRVWSTTETGVIAESDVELIDGKAYVAKLEVVDCRRNPDDEGTSDDRCNIATGSWPASVAELCKIRD